MATWIYNLIQNFILGGLIVSSISFVGTFMSPLLGAIWWSFPISLLPTLYFMNQQGKSNTYLARFTMSTTFAMALLIISTFALSKFLNDNKKNEIAMPIVKTAAIWLGFSVVFYFIVKHFKLDSRFI